MSEFLSDMDNIPLRLRKAKVVEPSMPSENFSTVLGEQAADIIEQQAAEILKLNQLKEGFISRKYCAEMMAEQAAEIARLKAENEQIQLAVVYKRFTVEDTVTGKQLKWWGTEARGENDD